ncbi:MAG TPA: PTS sugar transporter subunit IIA [Firmicutes bacterium]|nr:PTS sugar transporter subunit IIA [Bacillota bacterium]
MISIKDLIVPELIFIKDRVEGKNAAFEYLSRRIAGYRKKDAAILLQAVREREKKLSTGIGLGIAVPHGRIPQWGKTTLSVLLLKEPLEYEALDGEPVRLILLFISDKDKPCEHINVLSRISYILSESDCLERILKSTSPEGLYKSFVEYDDLL